MMGIIDRILAFASSTPRGSAYAVAMSESGDLLKRMEEAQRSNDPARSVMASIWRQRNNIPFMTTVHEAVTEANSPFAGTEAHAPPEKQK